MRSQTKGKKIKAEKEISMKEDKDAQRYRHPPKTSEERVQLSITWAASRKGGDGMKVMENVQDKKRGKSLNPLLGLRAL